MNCCIDSKAEPQFGDEVAPELGVVLPLQFGAQLPVLRELRRGAAEGVALARLQHVGDLLGLALHPVAVIRHLPKLMEMMYSETWE
jgi:hypothetical protein